MSKQKKKTVVKNGKLGSVTTGDSTNIRVIIPRKIDALVAGAVGGHQKRPIIYNEKNDNENGQLNWHMLDDLSNEVSNMILGTAKSFHEIIELVKAAKYCDKIERFSVNVKVVSDDLLNYTEEFSAIHGEHEKKSGFIDNAEDRVLYLKCFERYQQLNALFNGTMHHKLIEFTEYALDAKDYLLSQAPAEGKEETTQPDNQESSNV